jgi:hypothetical protein
MSSRTEKPSQEAALEAFAGILAAGRKALETIAAEVDSAAAERASRGLKAARSALEKAVE